MCKAGGRAAAGRQAVPEFRPFRPDNFVRIDRPARPRPLNFPGRQAVRPIGLSHKIYRQRHVLNYEIMQCVVCKHVRKANSGVFNAPMDVFAQF